MASWLIRIDSPSGKSIGSRFETCYGSTLSPIGGPDDGACSSLSIAVRAVRRLWLAGSRLPHALPERGTCPPAGAVTTASSRPRAGTTSGPQVVPRRQRQLPREEACLWRSGPKTAVPWTEDGPALRVTSSEPCLSPPAPNPMDDPQHPPDLECCFHRLSPINTHRSPSLKY